MKKNERIIYFFDFGIKASCRNFDAPKTITVRKAFEIMELIPASERINKIFITDKRLYISAWKQEGNIISILVNQSDQTMSDPVFTIPEEKKRRTVKKNKNEGQDYSSHIVIQLPHDELDDALLLVEKCPGLSTRILEMLFNQILSDAKLSFPAQFEQNHPDGVLDKAGKPKQLNVKFTCELQGHLSEEFKRDLDQGNIHNIELITEKGKNISFDEDGYIVEKCKTLVLTTTSRQNPIKDKFEKIFKLIQGQKDNYEKAKIRFTSSIGQERTVTVDTKSTLEDVYVKRAKLKGFSEDLESSYADFFDEILSKMKKLLEEERT